MTARFALCIGGVADGKLHEFGAYQSMRVPRVTKEIVDWPPTNEMHVLEYDSYRLVELDEFCGERWMFWLLEGIEEEQVIGRLVNAYAGGAKPTP